MPILEGLDGVQKMSKSYGNAIGIKEPPFEMYGKLMSISDEMMWRYYELLTDVQMAEIERMKRESHPMQAKKDLAARIVKDFHSAEAATKAADDWAKQFQKNEMPETVQRIHISFQEVRWSAEEVPDRPVTDLERNPPLGIRLDRLLVLCGLAESVSDAGRKLKSGAVKVNDEIQTQPRIHVAGLPAELSVRVGRQLKIVVIDQ